MKRYVLFCSGIILLLFGCEKSDIMLYEQHPAIYFEQETYSYSFLEDPDAENKTIRLLCDISGSQVDYDRKFDVRVSSIDSLTTAEPDQYRLGEGVVKANDYAGHFEVEVFKDQRLDDSVYQLALEIVPNDDFPEVRLNQKTLILSFTNKVIQPANWNKLRWYFGTGAKDYFSTAWWKFICSVTGMTSLPFNDSDPDKETWWMTMEELIAHATRVHLALIKYNADPNNPDRPLKHDDGPYAGQPIEWTVQY